MRNGEWTERTHHRRLCTATELDAMLRRANLMRDMAQIGNDAFLEAREEHPPGSTEQYTIASGSVADVLPGLPQELVDFISGMTDGTYTYNGYEITLSGGQLTVSKIITINYQMGMHLLPNAYWKSWVGVNTAQAAYDGAQQMLNLLYRIRNDPQELEAQVDAAEAQYHAAEAMVELAQAQLDGLRDGATAEEIAAVEAQVQQAQAQLDSARVLVDKLTLTAPASGQVLAGCGSIQPISGARFEKSPGRGQNPHASVQPTNHRHGPIYPH